MDQAIEQSVEDRMAALVEAEDAPPEDDREGDHPRVKAAEGDSEAEIDQEKEETTPTDQRTLKLKYEGEEVEKPESEVIELAQKGFDYTQKTQKLADDRRAVEAQAQAVKAQAQAFEQAKTIQAELIKEIAQVTAIDQQLSQYQGVNWQALSDSDPVQAQKLFFQMNQLQTQRGQLAQQVQQREVALTEKQQQLHTQRLGEAAAVLDRDLPSWRTDLKQTIIDTAKSYGASDQDLSSITDPWIIKAVADAAQWRKLKASPITANKTAEAKPMVKPGSKDPKAAQTSQLKETRKALKQTGKSDYAAKLIERMI